MYVVISNLPHFIIELIWDEELNKKTGSPNFDHFFNLSCFYRLCRGLYPFSNYDYDWSWWGIQKIPKNPLFSSFSGSTFGDRGTVANGTGVGFSSACAGSCFIFSNRTLIAFIYYARVWIPALWTLNISWAEAYFPLRIPRSDRFRRIDRKRGSQIVSQAFSFPESTLYPPINRSFRSSL